MEKNVTPENSRKNQRVLFIAIALIICAGLFGWLLGQSNTTTNGPTNGVNPDSSSESQASATDVDSIISYTMPGGWTDASCENQDGAVFIVPSGASLDCDGDLIAPIRITVDPQNTTECQQLSNVQNVRKHVCKSLFIDGHKTLQASTEYLKSSEFSTDTTVSDYYIDTGKGVIRIQYIYTSGNDYQTGFDQLSSNVTVKN